jgi:hypothetical protein
MSNNLSRPGITIHHIDSTRITLVAGADEWVDTDVSAITGTDSSKIWLISIYNSGSGNTGARAVGSTTNPYVAASGTNTCMAKVNSSGHMELRRAAVGNIFYDFLGYLN